MGFGGECGGSRAARANGAVVWVWKRRSEQLERMEHDWVAPTTALGTAEKVVDVGPIHLRMAAWPDGRLDLYPGAEHEVPMEQAAHRGRFADEAAKLFDAQR